MEVLREILFRARSKISDAMVEGSIVLKANGDAYIVGATGAQTPVYSETVGQYTGKTDKNRKRIFEGDICRIGKLLYKVEFKCSAWWFTILSKRVYCCPAFNYHCGERCEVIGNIHDGHDYLGGME